MAVQAMSATKRAKPASRAGFFASLMGASADSNPPKAKINSTIAFIHALAGRGTAAPQGAGWMIVTAAPASTTISKGRIFATVNRLLTAVPWRAPRALISASNPTSNVRIRKRGHGSLAAGQNSAK
jgi:hypothetical protein